MALRRMVGRLLVAEGSECVCWGSATTNEMEGGREVLLRMEMGGFQQEEEEEDIRTRVSNPKQILPSTSCQEHAQQLHVQRHPLRQRL